MINNCILFQKTAYTETERSQKLWLMKGVKETECTGMNWGQVRLCVFLIHCSVRHYILLCLTSLTNPSSPSMFVSCIYPHILSVLVASSSSRSLQNIKSFFHIKQRFNTYFCHNLTHKKSALTSAWLWTDSLESELSVPSVDPRRLRLFALRTIVATVRQ